MPFYHVPLTRVDRVLGDYPALLRTIADKLDKTVRFGTDEAEQLREIAADMDHLTLAIQARLQGDP